MLVNRCAVAVAMSVVVAAAAGAGGFQPLFNGKDLDGWVAEGKTDATTPGGQTRPVWSAEDGMIVCHGSGFGFLRYDRREFIDFVFHVEFRMAKGCNSGLGVRTRAFDPKKSRATRPSYYSYEIQLTDDAGKPASKLSSGSLYRYVAPRENAMKPALEWNAIDITCDGPRVQVTLNGKPIIDVDQGTIDALKDKPRKGYVCLQNHGGTIEFRNIRIREIEPSEAEKRR